MCAAEIFCQRPNFSADLAEIIRQELATLQDGLNSVVGRLFLLFDIFNMSTPEIYHVIVGHSLYTGCKFFSQSGINWYSKMQNFIL
jgi:hypothetical protein